MKWEVKTLQVYERQLKLIFHVMAGFKIAVYTSWGVKKRENTSVSAITIHGVVLSINNYYQAWCWDKE